ncbi:MAG TPA: hypothetical protein VJH24_04645 [Candidatus Bilamarchaeaceae archaeon]|nr:hypothetical protein [Candidatus Bilamarchaeaceae archaeon]
MASPKKKAKEKTPKIRKIREGMYKVESHSKPGRYHTVTSEYGDYFCDCAGFRFRKACRHVQTVYEKEIGKDNV